MIGSIYFCIECGLEKYKEQIHVKYGFKLCYITNRFIGSQRKVYFKVLCLCKRCFRNIAAENLQLKRKRQGYGEFCSRS